MDQERRYERLTILGQLTGAIMVFEPMTVKVLSAGGAAIETRFPLPLESLHDIRLSLPDQSIVLKGRVVHSHIVDVDGDIVTYVSGLEFVEPSERVRTVIDEFLETVKARRAGT